MRSDSADFEGFGSYPKRYYVLDRLHISMIKKFNVKMLFYVKLLI